MPAAVEDGIPGGEEVEQAVRNLKRVISGGPSGMRTKDLNGWLRETYMETDLVTYRWQMLVPLIQTTFKGGAVPEVAAWATMVLLPKGRGEYRGIDLVEVVWKVCATVVNYRLKRTVTLHGVLHGLRAGRGTRTATLEANMEHQLAGLTHEPLL